MKIAYIWTRSKHYV